MTEAEFREMVLAEFQQMHQHLHEVRSQNERLQAALTSMHAIVQTLMNIVKRPDPPVFGMPVTAPPTPTNWGTGPTGGAPTPGSRQWWVMTSATTTDTGSL